MVTRASFLLFIRNVMGIPSSVLPDNSQYIDDALAYSLEIVHDFIAAISSITYDKAVYNLAGHNLIEDAQDVTPLVVYKDGLPYFQYWRKTWLLNSFVPGVIQSTGDEGTNSSMLIPHFVEDMGMSDLELIKTPWGRTYQGIAQKIGGNWGRS